MYEYEASYTRPEDVDTIQVTFDLQGRVLRYCTYQEFDGDPAVGLVTQLLWNVDGGNGHITVMLGGAAPVLQRLEMLIASSGIPEEMDFGMLCYGMDSSGTQEEEDTRIRSTGCERQEYAAELATEEAVRTKHRIAAAEAVKTRQRAELAAEIAVGAAKVRRRVERGVEAAKVRHRVERERRIKGYVNAAVDAVKAERGPLGATHCARDLQDQVFSRKNEGSARVADADDRQMPSTLQPKHVISALGRKRRRA